MSQRGRVKWDEQGLAQADLDLHSITKRDNRPPPEPKTPFIALSAGCSSPDDEQFMLEPGSGTASPSTDAARGDGNVDATRTQGRRESTDASEEEDFSMHRKHHYMHDGEALAKGRALLESDPE